MSPPLDADVSIGLTAASRIVNPECASIPRFRHGPVPCEPAPGSHGPRRFHLHWRCAPLRRGRLINHTRTLPVRQRHQPIARLQSTRVRGAFDLARIEVLADRAHTPPVQCVQSSMCSTPVPARRNDRTTCQRCRVRESGRGIFVERGGNCHVPAMLAHGSLPLPWNELSMVRSYRACGRSSLTFHRHPSRLYSGFARISKFHCGAEIPWAEFLGSGLRCAVRGTRSRGQSEDLGRARPLLVSYLGLKAWRRDEISGFPENIRIRR